MARGWGTVTVSIIGKADKLKAALDQSDRDLESFGSKLEGFGKKSMAVGAKFTAGLTLPIVGGLGLATKAAADDEEAQAKLAKTLENTVGASKAVVASVEDQITAFMKVSTFADDDLRPAYSNLVRSTKDVDEANRLMALAMDIAAAKGLPLEQVSMGLAKAHDGNVGALGRLGIATKDAEGKTKSFDQVMQDATATFGGSAATALDTSAGQTKALTRDMGELVEQIGTALIPILDRVIPIIRSVAEWFSELSPAMQTTILVVAGLAAAIGPLVTIVGALSTAIAFLAANPIVLAVAAVAALAAGLVYAYKKSETFRDIVNGAFEAVKTVMLASPIGLVITHWNDLKDAVTDAVDWIVDKVTALIDAVKSIPGAVKGAVGGVVNAIPGAGVAKGIFKAVTPFADGGIVTRPTLGLVGEAGPEAIIPLNRMGGAGAGISITVNGALDPATVAGQIRDILLAEKRRSGPLGLA